MAGARALLAAVTLLAAASAAFGIGQALTIGDLYDGGTVNLTPGDELVVRLSSNPSTGYSWSVVFNDATVLKPQGEAAIEKSEGGLLGAPGFEVFRFKAIAAGSASLGLAYRKSSDPKAPPAGLFRVLAAVKDSAPRRSLILEDPDSGSDIFLTQGDTILVKLPSNPTTGYAWSIAGNAPSVLQPAGEPKFEGPQKAMPGAGGFQTFEFRVASGGGAALQLVYRRPFEKDTAPARTWNIFVAAAATANLP